MDPILTADDSQGLIVIFWVMVLLLGLLLLAALFGRLAMTWLRAYMFGIPVSIVQLLAMRLRGVPPGFIVDSVVTLVQRGYRYDPLMYSHAQTLYLSRRGALESPSQLADLAGQHLLSDGPG
jgi:uncharacterized protein YqfA (UPF0365 family)